MSEYNPENESGDEPPPFIKSLISAFEQRLESNKAVMIHRDKVELEAQGIAQKLRVAVYAATDRIDGPSESEAFGALRQWRKAVDKLAPIMRRCPDAHKEAVAEAIVAMVDLYKRESCPCAKCVAEREGRAGE